MLLEFEVVTRYDVHAMYAMLPNTSMVKVDIHRYDDDEHDFYACLGKPDCPACKVGREKISWQLWVAYAALTKAFVILRISAPPEKNADTATASQPSKRRRSRAYTQSKEMRDLNVQLPVALQLERLLTGIGLKNRVVKILKTGNRFACELVPASGLQLPESEAQRLLAEMKDRDFDVADYVFPKLSRNEILEENNSIRLEFQARGLSLSSNPEVEDDDGTEGV